MLNVTDVIDILSEKENKQKAKEIANKNKKIYVVEKNSFEESFNSALEAMEWKQQQILNYLKDKLEKCKDNSANIPLKALLFDEIAKDILS